MKDHRKLLALAAFLLALATALGAFGAHALEGMFNAHRLETWETAVQYHAWNSLGILALLLISKAFKTDLKLPVQLILAGIFIFSGSLYVLCLTDASWLGAITPIGGVAFIAGWCLAGLRVLKKS